MTPDPNESYTRPLCKLNIAIECKHGKKENYPGCETCGWNPEVEERRIKELYGEDEDPTEFPGAAYLYSDDEEYYAINV